MPMIAAGTRGQYACLSGQNDGSMSPELTIHRAGDFDRAHVRPPNGWRWNAGVAVGDGTVVADAIMADVPAQQPRAIFEVTPGDSDRRTPAIRKITCPPLRHSIIYDMALTPGAAHVLIVLDAGVTGPEEYLVAAPVRAEGPARTWALSDPGVHVRGVAAGPDGTAVLTVVGAPDRPQHRRVLRCRLDRSDPLTDATVLLEDGDQDIYEIYSADLSPDGSLLAVAYTSDLGAFFNVAVMRVDGGPLRRVWRRSCAEGDPGTSPVSFDDTGEHLLFGFDDIVQISLDGSPPRTLARSVTDRWLRAAC